MNAENVTTPVVTDANIDGSYNGDCEPSDEIMERGLGPLELSSFFFPRHFGSTSPRKLIVIGNRHLTLELKQRSWPTSE